MGIIQIENFGIRIFEFKTKNFKYLWLLLLEDGYAQHHQGDWKGDR